LFGLNLKIQQTAEEELVRVFPVQNRNALYPWPEAIVALNEINEPAPSLKATLFR
jgi:hypothetical protein